MTASSETRDRSALKRALARIAAEDGLGTADGESSSGAPSWEDLVRLREGNLDEAEERAIREKIERYPAESEPVLAEIDLFLEPPQADSPPDVRARRAWTKTRDRLVDRQAGDDSLAAPGSRGGAFRPPRLGLALAAGIALVAAGLALWSLRLVKEVQHLETQLADSTGPSSFSGSRPVLSTSVQDLSEESSTLREIGVGEIGPRGVGTGAGSGETSADQVLVRPATATVTVLLHTAEGLEPGQYSIEWVAETGAREETLWTLGALTPSADGSLALVLPSGRLPLGASTLKVFRAGAESSGEALATFRFDVVAEE